MNRKAKSNFHWTLGILSWPSLKAPVHAPDVRAYTGFEIPEANLEILEREISALV